MEWVRFGISAAFLLFGILMFLAASIGVNRFRRALNRMHAAALGDTLGILFVILGLIIWKGISFDSLKLLLVVLFFWLASPVAGHMISRLEVTTDEDLGEIEVEHHEDI
ncbi:monovalent cation/H(+) antiporter subunit G [Lacrimispora sp. NSJ-141]|uniref:Monovalent cation/H(+) antiporter subunit G n=1 Tax=Lientehia hominis TaxID=2897778 RepID=A0AAP2RG49_9FIRM|nr:monovalent cation/H(+) antiporter subunit G [Lientehia hominis]MCD2491362.1 monovalent cation/H(+) antiporter subunit G [Lientehia hominis]